MIPRQTVLKQELDTELKGTIPNPLLHETSFFYRSLPQSWQLIIISHLENCKDLVTELLPSPFNSTHP